MKPRDISGSIARLLFAIGALWALFLIILLGIGIVFAISLSPETLGVWLLVAYLVCGFAVWIGWGWRSRRIPPLRSSLALWLGSFVVNALFPCVLIAEGSGSDILSLDGNAAVFWWWAIASTLSLVAFFYEFRLSKADQRTA